MALDREKMSSLSMGVMKVWLRLIYDDPAEIIGLHLDVLDVLGVLFGAVRYKLTQGIQAFQGLFALAVEQLEEIIR
ncbi:MAG: hypothetical protein MZU91_02875 [Desulfosudis oleivorans]|nr:hypothetical protein [Desulfosudis oleivorans]